MIQRQHHGGRPNSQQHREQNLPGYFTSEVDIWCTAQLSGIVSQQQQKGGKHNLGKTLTWPGLRSEKR